MRTVSAVILICLGLLLAGADDPYRAQIDAATANAADLLRSDISQVPITSQLTIGQFIERTGSEEQFLAALRRAQQVGDPRWLDPEKQVCQVKLEIPGAQVIELLREIAFEQGNRSPVPVEALDTRLQPLRERSFVATGSSINPAKATGLRPRELSIAWAGVNEEARRRAVADATDAAVKDVLQNINAIRLDDDTTVSDAMRSDEVRQTVVQWIASRPVRSVQFHDDLHVEVTLAVPPAELFDILRAAVRRDQELKWDAARAEFLKRAPTAIGRAKANARATARVIVPAQPPEWVDRNTQIDATATASAAGEKLMSKTAAESKAIEELRAKVNRLSLAPGLSIGEAAERNKAVQQAVDNAMVRVRVAKIEWLADGRASAKVVLDSQRLWEELRQMPTDALTDTSRDSH